MSKQIISFLKKETVLCIAALLAFLSCFFVPPSTEYIDYIDFRVLALLFCLMLVVAGLQSIGVFRYLGNTCLSKMKNTRQLSLLLIALCFFSGMFITNDVALITFVPFAVMILSMSGKSHMLVRVVVLQTIAANLGSMLTPVGNPQNLYLYSTFEIPILTFLKNMLPLTVVSALLLVLSVFLLKKETLDPPGPGQTDSSGQDTDTGEVSSDSVRFKKPDSKKLIAYLVLFVLCLLCVIRLLPWPAMLAIILAAGLILDRSLFGKVDYFLLLTFLCFFLFIGNMERIPLIADFLRSFIKGRELLLSILFSQCISNLPAAILLSGFTDTATPLLYGVNIGGLGTLIASLASVISYRLYGNSKGASKGAYLKYFTMYSILFLAVLWITAALLLKIL